MPFTFEQPDFPEQPSWRKSAARSFYNGVRTVGLDKVFNPLINAFLFITDTLDLWIATPFLNFIKFFNHIKYPELEKKGQGKKDIEYFDSPVSKVVFFAVHSIVLLVAGIYNFLLPKKYRIFDEKPPLDVPQTLASLNPNNELPNRDDVLYTLTAFNIMQQLISGEPTAIRARLQKLAYKHVNIDNVQEDLRDLRNFARRDIPTDANKKLIHLDELNKKYLRVQNQLFSGKRIAAGQAEYAKLYNQGVPEEREVAKIIFSPRIDGEGNLNLTLQRSYKHPPKPAPNPFSFSGFFIASIITYLGMGWWIGDFLAIVLFPASHIVYLLATFIIPGALMVIKGILSIGSSDTAALSKEYTQDAEAFNERFFAKTYVKSLAFQYQQEFEILDATLKQNHIRPVVYKASEALASLRNEFKTKFANAKMSSDTGDTSKLPQPVQSILSNKWFENFRKGLVSWRLWMVLMPFAFYALASWAAFLSPVAALVLATPLGNAIFVAAMLGASLIVAFGAFRNAWKQANKEQQKIQDEISQQQLSLELIPIEQERNERLRHLNTTYAETLNTLIQNNPHLRYELRGCISSALLIDKLEEAPNMTESRSSSILGFNIFKEGLGKVGSGSFITRLAFIAFLQGVGIVAAIATSTWIPIVITAMVTCAVVCCYNVYKNWKNAPGENMVHKAEDRLAYLQAQNDVLDKRAQLLDEKIQQIQHAGEKTASKEEGRKPAALTHSSIAAHSRLFSTAKAKPERARPEPLAVDTDVLDASASPSPKSL